VLKVEIETEVEEDSDQLESQVRRVKNLLIWGFVKRLSQPF
jgi:hypothetical protein